MISFDNFHEFLKTQKENPKDCMHSFPEEYSEIGDICDRSFVPLSYLALQTEDENEIIMGSYPYNGAKIWKCNKCSSLTFSYTNDSGWGQLVKLPMNLNKEYITEPVSKHIVIKKKDYDSFIKQFNLKNAIICKEEDRSTSGSEMIAKNTNYIFNLTEWIFDDTVSFNLVASRSLAREIALYIKSLPEK